MLKLGLITVFVVLAAISGVHLAPFYLECELESGVGAVSPGNDRAAPADSGSRCDGGRVNVSFEPGGVLHWSCRESAGVSGVELLEERFVGAFIRREVEVSSDKAFDVGDIYSGIGLRLEPRQAGPVKILTLAPAADPCQVQVAVDSRLPVRVNGCGSLEISPEGAPPLTVVRPVAYQDIPAGRHFVDVQLSWKDGRYGLNVGRYNSTDTLTVELRAY